MVIDVVLPAMLGPTLYVRFLGSLVLGLIHWAGTHWFVWGKRASKPGGKVVSTELSACRSGVVVGLNRETRRVRLEVGFSSS